MTDTCRYDDNGNFVGHEPRECGEHRTVGSHRAWCFDCAEWCYPEEPCIQCEIPALRAPSGTCGWCGTERDEFSAMIGDTPYCHGDGEHEMCEHASCYELAQRSELVDTAFYQTLNKHAEALRRLCEHDQEAVWHRLEDQALLDRDDLQESLRQMRDGETVPAEEVERTLMPADQFDELVETLDEPDDAPRLEQAFRKWSEVKAKKAEIDAERGHVPKPWPSLQRGMDDAAAGRVVNRDDFIDGEIDDWIDEER